MKYSIKDSILNLDKNSYAKDNHLPKDLSKFINCSAGTNPMGFSKKVKEALSDIPLELINEYPESSNDFKETMIQYWKNLCHIDKNQILLGDGSIEIIYKINKLFISSNSKVLGYSPQFTDYISDIQGYGAVYDYYLMDMENKFKFNPESFSKKMDKIYKLFYIDNPNNPTGQVINIADIEEIVDKAKSLRRPIIIDEAYGDFMEMDNSAISLTNKYDNLFVIRTFSKALGLAGLRGGYAVTSNSFAESYGKISTPYEMGGITRYLAIIAIKDKSFMMESIKKLSKNKKNLIESLTKLVVLETDLSIPIMTIMHPDFNVDLEELLLDHNIISVPGKGFIGLGKNFVRIRLPKSINRLLEAFKQVENKI